MTKSCTSCGLEKTLEEFRPKKRYALGRDSQCRPCVRLQDKARRARNPERQRVADRAHYWRNPEPRRQKSRGFRFAQKYWPGLTAKQALEEWNRMFTEQEGKCAICKDSKPLDVDHNHATGVVRSLLCNGCNTAFARVKERVATLENMIDYARRWNCAD